MSTKVGSRDITQATLRSNWRGFGLDLLLLDGSHRQLTWNKGANRDRLVLDVLSRSLGPKYRFAA